MRDVAADHLNVDGRRKAEVQDLSHDVRRLDEEGGAGKLLGQRVAQLRNILAGWPVLSCEGHQDLGIGGAYDAAVAVRKVDTADGQANIVENSAHLGCRDSRANHAFHLVGSARCFFYSSTRLRPQVEPELARVHRRKEVLPRWA